MAKQMASFVLWSAASRKLMVTVSFWMLGLSVDTYRNCSSSTSTLCVTSSVSTTDTLIMPTLRASGWMVQSATTVRSTSCSAALVQPQNATTP